MPVPAKIVQMSGKKKESAQRFSVSFPSAALSYEKIVQMSGKKKESAQRFSVSFPSAAFKFFYFFCHRKYIVLLYRNNLQL